MSGSDGGDISSVTNFTVVHYLVIHIYIHSLTSKSLQPISINKAISQITLLCPRKRFIASRICSGL